MLGNHKKRNDIARRAEVDETLTAPPSPPVIPPLRTFVLYGPSYGFRPLPGEAVAKDAVHGFAVDAHGLAIDESRMLSFVVFYFMGGDPTKPTQTTKLAVNADAWTEVEEINAEFPTLVKH